MKTRRHHNTDGRRQIQRGKTREQVERMAGRLGVPYGSTMTSEVGMSPSESDVIARARSEKATLEAQIATCDHFTHQHAIGCPYCTRDTRQSELLRDLLALVAGRQAPAPADQKEKELAHVDSTSQSAVDATGGRNELAPECPRCSVNDGLVREWVSGLQPDDTHGGGAIAGKNEACHCGYCEACLVRWANDPNGGGLL